MPDLAGSLRDKDLEQLADIAELWGIDLSAPDVRSARDRLVQILLDPQLVNEVTAALPEQARNALTDLQSSSNRLPWKQFTRRYGEVREMGSARLARIRPHRNPASITEHLWYRALISRAFFDTPSGPQEFAYIPEDLHPLLPEVPQPEVVPWGRPARPAERAHLVRSSDAIVDHACTVLAGLRAGFSTGRIAALAPEVQPEPDILVALLASAGLLDSQGVPRPEQSRLFLEAPRSQALSQLASAWLESNSFNDLRMLPFLEVEGAWQNQPLQTRKDLLAHLGELPIGKWWHLGSFIDAVYRQDPDFQRHAGDYDSWYLKDARTGAYLRGFDHWHDIEGRLIRWLITGPLYWFGAVDLGNPESEAIETSFRLTSIWKAMMSGNPFPKSAPESAGLHIDSKGRLALPPGFPRTARYQFARFCEWEPVRKESYHYRLDAAALELARDNDLTVKQLIKLLRKHASADVPPNILNALKRWDAQGAQARLEQVTVLRLGDPAILKALHSSRASRFLGDPVGPAAVLVKSGAYQNVLDALLELGYLAQFDLNPEDEND